MRGNNHNEGAAFVPAAPSKRLVSSPYPAPIFLRPAEEYNSRNIRHLIPSTIRIRDVNVHTMPRKKPYPHIERRAYGGWGHVPSQQPATE